MKLPREIVESRRRAVREALNYISDGMVVGLGSGTTMRLFVEELASYIKANRISISVVPSSYDIMIYALGLGLHIIDPMGLYEIDIAFDGADEVDAKLNLLKGGGAALTREKIIDSMSRKTIIIVDYTKLVDKLCTRKPLPVEVAPPALSYVSRRLKEVMECRDVKVRQGAGKVGPIVTDNGFFIIDLYPKNPIEPDDVERVSTKINMIPGVLENGLFPRKLVDTVIVGFPDRVEVLKAR